MEPLCFEPQGTGYVSLGQNLEELLFSLATDKSGIREGPLQPAQVPVTKSKVGEHLAVHPESYYHPSGLSLRREEMETLL